MYAGLPTKVSLALPYVISAAFDPNTARTQIQQSEWNEWLWEAVSGLVTTLALHLIEEEPAAAWCMIPTSDETLVPMDRWIQERIEGLAVAVQNAVSDRGRVAIGDSVVKLQRISYECEALDDLLTSDDFATLAPRHVRLPIEARDAYGRWRTILDELEIGMRLDVADALSLLPLCVDRPLARSPQWYVRLACAALDADLESELEDVPCVLVGDPVALLAPASDGSDFSIDAGVPPLAARLDLVHKLHDSLLGEDEGQERIRNWLEGLGRLWHRLDATAVLDAIANRGADEPIELSDDDLVELRDLVDEVDEPDSDLLLRVGESVVIEAYQWIKKRRAEIWAPVGLLYFPPAMSEADGWPRVAARTPGLKWAAPRYATLLDPGDRRSGKSGGRRFLGMLGAANLFRVVHEPSQDLGHEALPELQARRFRQLLWEDQEFRERGHRPRGLRDDYISPDLERAVEDLCSVPAKERDERGLALIKVLDRSWRLSLQQKAFCTATYSYYGKQELGDIRATWIARLADSPWLYDRKRRPAKPIDLAIRSPLNRVFFGDAKSRFAAGIEDDLTPGLAETLGFKERPTASFAVDQLAELKASGEIVEWRDVSLLYAHLADLCSDISAPASLEARVDDITVRQLRGRFGINPRAGGLIAIDGAWRVPTAVLRGRPIFGGRRSFVPTGRHENLWNALGIREPNVADCIEVLEEIASTGGVVSEEGVLTDTLRHLNALLESATPKKRDELASAPLWSGSGWVTRRPIYYIADETAAQSLAATHDVWRPPCPLEEMAPLVEALGVTFIPAENCVPTGIEPRTLVVERSLRDEYSLAVEALKDYLARNYPEVYRGTEVDWRELRNADVVVAPGLSLEIVLPNGGRVEAETDAHMTKDPLTLYLRDRSLLFEHDAGGRAVSQCFGSSEHRKTVMLAWSHPHIQNRRRSSAMSLADDVLPEEDPLAALGRVVGKNVGKPIPGSRKIVPAVTQANLAEIEPRRLKSFDVLTHVKEARTVDVGAPPGKLLPNRKTPTAPQTLDGPVAGTRATVGAAPMGYTNTEREQLAMRVLEAVVWDEQAKLKDFTRLRGLGADAGDDLGRLFEIKAHGGDMPDSINLELSQRRAAGESPEKFYLAVVSGLEEGYETMVRLFARPMETLDMEEGTSIKLSGIRSKPAIEVRLGS